LGCCLRSGSRKLRGHRRERLCHLILLVCASLYGQTPVYDLIVANARIVDGTGNPWFLGNVAVSGDTIVAVGRLSGTARRTVDAKGLVVAPGFIDIHSHSRQAIFEHPAAENILRQGVTTVIDGNDGSSPLPLGAFFKKLEQISINTNFGSFVGQGSVREAVMGTENRAATPEEIGRMRALVRQAMLDGAMGISTGLFYVPGNYSPTEEILELVRVAGSLGGMHISHMREEASQILASVNETIRIGEEGGLPTQVTHHKIIGRANWGKSIETLALVEAARARGVDVTVDQYPYTASSTGTAALFPQWSLEGGRIGLLKRLSDPAVRAKIKAAIAERIRNDRGAGDPKNVVLSRCAWDPTLDGKSLGKITDERGRNPTFENAAETAIEIQEKGGCSAIYHAIDEEDIERILKYPFTMIASDGGVVPFGQGVPHPRNYGTFVRVLGRYVRERKVLSLEDAVRKMTSLPANRLGLHDRGVIRPGMKADLAVFDPALIADRATFLEPHQYAVGVRYVVLNGRLALADGKLTGDRPGRVLYGPAFRK
jgi:N-acyl-D-amino-acid deacylase